MIEPEPFEEDFQNSLTFQILYTANLHKTFRRRFQRKFISEEISPDVTSILYFTKCEPDITQAELARRLFKGKAHLGKILNEMEKQGLIKREYHNNSIKNIILPKGEELHQKAYKEFKRMKTLINKTFTKEEKEQFLSLISRYRSLLNSLIDVKLK